MILTCCKSPAAKNAAVAESTRPARRLNLVVVTIDTLRPDHLGCYGNSLVETPNLDQLAWRGALFQNAVTQVPLTPPSHATMFTGTLPPVHKVRDTGGFILQPENTTLAEILQQQGWQTAAFVGASVLSRSFGFAQGFDTYDDRMPELKRGEQPGEYPERRAQAVVDNAVNWLGSQAGKPFFLWVHLFDPHSPYSPPAPFRERYKGRLYDGEIAYTDQQLGRLLDAVAKKSPLEDTVVAVLSDHGESLSEHGEFTHGVFLYDSTLRIAFLLAGPGVPKGMRIGQQARAVDLSPTLLSLLGVPVPSPMQGVSLTPAFAHKEIPAAYSYAETLFPKINMGWSELRGMRTSRWKYIRAPKPELYDLLNDPSEAHNVLQNHPAEVQELEAKLRGLVSREKVTTTAVDTRTSEQLRSLGYLGGGSQTEYDLTGSGTDPKDRVEVLKLLDSALSLDNRMPVSGRIALLSRALKLDPSNPTIYYHLGEAYAQTGHDEQALQLYKQGLQKGVRTAWLYSRMARLQMKQGNAAEAIAAWERAAQLNPSDGESLSDLGLAYLDTGRLNDAERVFRWAATTSPRYAPAYNGLGLVDVRKDNFQGARSHFEKAVQLDPNLLEAQLNLGRIYKMTGENARARACFEAFLARASPAEYGEMIQRVRADLAEMPRSGGPTP